MSNKHDVSGLRQRLTKNHKGTLHVAYETTIPRFETVLRSFRSKEDVIMVGGLSYVGLSLYLAFTIADARVIGFDINAEKTRSLNEAENYLEYVPEGEGKNAIESQMLNATSDLAILQSCGSSIAYDTYISSVSIVRDEFESAVWDCNLLMENDAIFVVTDHDEIDVELQASTGCLMIDMRQVCSRPRARGNDMPA